MLWFLTLTQSCNMNCLYCGSGDAFDIEDLSPHPRELTYDLNKLTFLNNDKDLILCFYGGEPLLKIREITKIMTLLPNAKYVLQTNGSLLDKVPESILLKMDCILVSIDGDAAATDRNRGDGAHDRSVENAISIRQKGYKNDLVARMTVSDGSDIYNDVMHLINLCGDDGAPLFNHVHWQLDVLWDSPMFARWENFLEWRDNNYNPGISKLMDEFVGALQQGRVLGIAPFLGLYKFLSTGRPVERIMCGAGATSFNIATGGSITACPIAPEFKSLGEVSKDLDPYSFKDNMLISGICSNCDILGKCGGRCLYANHTSWWTDEGFAHVCNTVRHIISQMEERGIPAIKSALNRGAIVSNDVDYPPFNNSVEIMYVFISFIITFRP